MKTQRLKSKTQDCKDTFSLVVFPSLSPWPHMGGKATEATGGTGGFCIRVVRAIRMLSD